MIDVTRLPVCRVLGHAWEPFTPVGKRPPPWGWRISVRCTRCYRERHDLIDRNGNLSDRQYEPRRLPDLAVDYDGDRPAMADYRRAARRQLS